MKAALQAAGFPGVEEEGGVIHARLWSASAPFTATQEGDGFWRLALSWPVRATPAQIAQWGAAHPDAPMDIDAGETRITMRIDRADPAQLARWAAVAEKAVITCIGWRRKQRAPGEGM